MGGKIPSLNLIKQVNAESVVRKPSFYKPLIFGILTVVSAAAVGYVYRQYLGGQISTTLPILTLGVFAIFSALQIFFTKSIGKRFQIKLLETVALLVFFYDYDYSILAISAAIMITIPMIGEALGRRELENNLQIRFIKAVRPILSKLTTALVLVLIILYLPQWRSGNIFISEINFQRFFDWAAGVAGGFYPEVSFNSSFGKFAEGLAVLQLRENQVFKLLPPAERELAIKLASEGLVDSFGKSLGIEIAPEQSVGKVFYDFISKLLAGWQEQFQGTFLAGWVLSVFFVIRGLGTIFYWVVGFIAFIVYQMLLAIGYIHILGETRTHEIVEF